jgi:hypothetical protein
MEKIELYNGLFVSLMSTDKAYFLNNQHRKYMLARGEHRAQYMHCA